MQQLTEEQRNRLYARWYKNLRQKELVVLDGETKYLTGDELDEYCRSITPIEILTAKSMANAALKVLEEEFRRVHNEEKTLEP